jgi:hypothetical protein
MKKIFTYTTALLLSGILVKAQSSYTVTNNSSFKSLKEESQNLVINKNDSICYRSDIEATNISKRKVPSEVKEAFSKDFQNTKNAQWRMDLHSYAVDFKNHNKERVSAYYNSKGKLLEYITLKEKNTINASLLQQINSQFMNSEVTEVMEVKRSNSNEVFYVITMLDNGIITQHYFTSYGRLIEL